MATITMRQLVDGFRSGRTVAEVLDECRQTHPATKAEEAVLQFEVTVELAELEEIETTLDAALAKELFLQARMRDEGRSDRTCRNRPRGETNRLRRTRDRRPARKSRALEKQLA